jgi:hypothetical protein
MSDAESASRISVRAWFRVRVRASGRVQEGRGLTRLCECLAKEWLLGGRWG